MKEINPRSHGDSSEQGNGHEGSKNSPRQNWKEVLLNQRQQKNHACRRHVLPMANRNKFSAVNMSESKAKAELPAYSGDGKNNRGHITNSPSLRQHAELNLTKESFQCFYVIILTYSRELFTSQHQCWN
jgi:hypothetical protein